MLSAFPSLPLADPQFTTGTVRRPPPNDDTEFAEWRQFFRSLGSQGRAREYARLVRIHAALVSTENQVEEEGDREDEVEDENKVEEEGGSE